MSRVVSGVCPLPSGVSVESISMCSSSYLLSACFKRIIFCLLSTRRAAASARLFLSPSIWYSWTIFSMPFRYCSSTLSLNWIWDSMSWMRGPRYGVSYLTKSVRPLLLVTSFASENGGTVGRLRTELREVASCLGYARGCRGRIGMAGRHHVTMLADLAVLHGAVGRAVTI